MNSLNNVNRENLFEVALSKVSDSICMVNLEGDIVYANQQFCREYGIEGLPFEGKYYDLSISSPNEANFKARTQEILENGGTSSFKTRYVSVVDGKIHYNQCSAFAMNTEEGVIIAFFMQDITDLLKSQDELRELNFLMDTILDNLPVYLFVKDVDDDLRYLYWNKAFSEYSGIPKKSVIGKTDYEVFPSYEDAKKFREDDMELVRNMEPINRHETYQATDGKMRMVHTTKCLCPREGRGPLLIGVSIDITHLENIEQELVQERLRAEESDKMKSSFLANMSHEIRTPLNAIVGFSNLLAEVDDPESRKQFVEIINQNSESLLQLINDILDISKIEAGTIEYTRETMDLTDTMFNIYEFQSKRMPEGVKLVLDIDPVYGHIIIDEDRNRISQVINNLINNAIKFTHEGYISFGYRIKNDHIDVYVSDTGQGIAPEYLNKVFDRFVKLNKFAQGTGLGLAICKLIVGLMHGELTVESEIGKGSTFRFTIPYEANRAPSIEPKAKEEVKSIQAKVGMPDNKQHTILVAEDTNSNFLLLKTLLGKRYNLVWAQDGAQAVEMYKEVNPDLILMDVKMPVIDGLEATRLIRTHSASVPIVGLTAFAFSRDREKAINVGMNDYLTKPVSAKALNEVLEKYLG